MSKTQKLEFKLNSSPHLKMSEITKQLFNRNFHSDVHFSVEGKIIYAHSLELIKRSVVFEQQLEDIMGDTKLIPINDFKYESFLEFIRFIYTDDCKINDDNGIEILKLATKYKVIILENRVLSLGKSPKWLLKCFEHCIRDKYETVHNFVHIALAGHFDLCLQDKQLLSLHPDTIDQLLNFERVKIGVTEVQISTAVANWIVLYCKEHQIPLTEGRRIFDKQIRKIRFPTMTNEKIREYAKKYPGLLTESDYISIARQAVFDGGVGLSGNDLWISRGREEFIWPGVWRTLKPVEKFETILSVSNHTILHGFRIETSNPSKPIEIEISEAENKTKASTCQKLMFVQNAPHHLYDLIICLGDSICLKPHFKYTISIEYLDIMNENCKVACRKKNTDVIINDPGKTVNIIQASANMMEIFFKLPSD